MAVAKVAGTWTYDDLFTLPDDGKRYEIIEGELYQLPSPNAWHATIIFNLVLLLGPMIRAMGGRFFPGPVDVFVPGADPVIPDILILMPGSRTVVRKRGVEGPPDLVIEVLSPSNRSHDLVTKRRLYGRAGVREYWIVDPAARSVEILTQQDDVLTRASMARGEGEIQSPLLNTIFSLADIFTDVDDDEPE